MKKTFLDVVLSFLFSAAIGAVFGYFPAKRGVPQPD